MYIRNTDGYFNATQMCKAAQKEWNHYISNKTTLRFMCALKGRHAEKQLTETLVNVPNHARGTWVCPEVAVHLSMWLSPDWAVEISCLLVNAATQEILQNGVSTVYTTMMESVKKEGERVESDMGLLYAVTAPQYDACKLGFWRGSLESLRKRYRTYFTSKMELVTTTVVDAPSNEKMFLQHFAPFCVEGEVFRKAGWEKYRRYIMDM